MHPSARRLGVGQDLLRHVAQLARDDGARAFGFHTAEFMTGAVELYERMGYRRATRVDTDLGTIYGIRTPTPLRCIAYCREFVPSS